MPSDGESCERHQHHSNEKDQDDDEEELDDSDSAFEGVRDRLRVYELQLEIPCSNGTYCSEEGECRPICS